MKKITLLAVAALAIRFASCKKDRTCTCTNTKSSGSTTVTVYTLTKAKKGPAKDFCTKNSQTSTFGSTTQTDTQDCKLS